jgi:MFS family permease
VKLDAVAGGRLAALAHVATHPAAWRRLPGTLRDRVFPSLTYPAYARLWRANLGSTTAYWMQSVAQGWLVVELTGSPFVLGLLAFFRSIPMLLLAPVGGVLADRQNRPRLLLVAQSMLAVTALAIALLIALDRIEIWHLIISSLVVGVTFTLSVPARHSMVSDLVPRHLVGNAVGLNSATQNGARMIGPSIAGLLIGVVGIAGAYFAQVVGYIWSILNVIGLRSADTHTRAQGSTLTILRDGFAYVRRTKVILAMMVLTLAPALFGMPIIMLLPAFVKQDLGGGALDLGILMSTFGVGALIGSMLVVVRSDFRYRGRVVLVTALVYSLTVIALGFTRSMLTAGLVLAVSGFFQAVYMAVNQTILQLTVPSEIRGRVMSIWMINWGLMPLGLLPLSAAAERFGTPVAMLFGGALSAAVVLVVMAWGRELWSLRSPPPERSAAADG